MSDSHGHEDAHGGGHGHAGHGKSGLKRESIIFVAIIAAAIAVLYATIFVLKLSVLQILLVLGLIWLLVLLSPKFVQYQQYERAVRFRFGRFYGVLHPGLHILFPYFERDVVVDIRTQVLDISPQDVITNDNIRLKIDAVSYFRVIDPKKAILEIKDYRGSLEKFLYAQIRNQISSIPLQKVLDQTDEINTQLLKLTQKIAGDYGMQVTRVEIEKIEIPPDLATAMQRRKEAEENKVRTETDAQARQIYLNILNTAVTSLSDNTMTYLYLDTLKRVGDGKSTKLIFPLELSKLATNISKIMGDKSN